MPTPSASETEQQGVGGAAKQVAEHASSLARLELGLVGLGRKSRSAALGSDAGLGLGAALMVLFALGFGLATTAAALALVVDTWLALLIVTVGVLVLAGILGLLARSQIRRGTPPVP